MNAPLPGLDPFIDRLQAISERYERVYGIDRGGDWHLLKMQEEMGELTQAYLAMTGRSRRDAASAKQEVAMEMADLICMTLLMARAEGIDLNAAISEKWLRWEAVMRTEAQSQKCEAVLGLNCAPEDSEAQSQKCEAVLGLNCDTNKNA